MDDEHKKLGFDFFMKYMPYFAAAGAIVGAIQFCNGHVTAVSEALLTPIVYALGFVFLAFLVVLGFGLIDSVLDTENKRIWGAAAVFIIATIVAVAHVL